MKSTKSDNAMWRSRLRALPYMKVRSLSCCMQECESLAAQMRSRVMES